MIALMDRFLNRFTMYRLTLYYLAALLALGVALGALGILPVAPLGVLTSTAVLLAVTLALNALAARALQIASNPESTIITALILALILTPPTSAADLRALGTIALSGGVAIASKYLLAVRRQHLLNPAAAGALFSGLVFGAYASWWVGSSAMLPLVLVGAILLARKISRVRLLALFLAVFVTFNVSLAVIQGLTVDLVLQSLLFVFGQTSLLFFAAAMLTEPMTSPKRYPLQAVYAAIVALLYQPQLAILGHNLTPEEALAVGNLFSFLVSPSFKLRLPLAEAREIGRGIWSFSFPKPRGFRHRPGQYMEWTLALGRGDGKGSRRHFSIASSPTEPDIVVAARFTPPLSRYKEVLMGMRPGSVVTSGELGGDFVLPRDPGVKLLFIAGGIGITPFRSMIRYLVDTGDKRDAVLLYSNYRNDEIVFRDVLCQAERAIGLRVVHTLTEPASVPKGWDGCVGFIDSDMLRAEVPDLGSRRVYVSGSPGMVNAMKRELRLAGVRRASIRTDYFPGYST